LNRNYAWQYGRLQIRAKLPTGKGLFPAFWLMTASGKRLPEIDLMEMLGHKPDEVWMVEHYWDEAKKHRRSYSVYNGTDFSRGFHTYELDWRASGVTWRIDGKRVHHTRQAPHEPMYIILNTAIGGNWPGRPDATTNFPQTLQVDWIKVSR
jgi:beta-glucanase (GH16 family)